MGMDDSENNPDERTDSDPVARQTAGAMRGSCVQPYLFFSGRCQEALEFYTKAIGAAVTMMMRFSESPGGVPEGMLQEGFEEKIMHAAMSIGETTVMASDGCDEKSKFESFRLMLIVPHEADCDRAFHALAEGGKIEMPPSKTFWSPRYGMVTDKFGVGWTVMVAGQPA